MHLLRIEPKPGGVRLHDGDATHEALTAFPLPLYLLCESPNLIVIVLVLNDRARGDPAFSLPLFAGIDLTIEPYLYNVVGLMLSAAATPRTSRGYSSGGCVCATARWS